MAKQQDKKTWQDIKADQEERVRKGIEFINHSEPFRVQCSLRIPNSKQPGRLSMNIDIFCQGGMKPHGFVTNLKNKRYRYEFLNNIPKHATWIGYSRALDGYDDLSKQHYHLGKIRNRKNIRYYTTSKMIPLTTASVWMREDVMYAEIQWDKHHWIIQLDNVDPIAEPKTALNFAMKGAIQMDNTEWW